MRKLATVIATMTCGIGAIALASDPPQMPLKISEEAIEIAVTDAEAVIVVGGQVFRVPLKQESKPDFTRLLTAVMPGGPGPDGPLAGCDLECPPDALLEDEPCGEDFNGGCNSDPPMFTPAACGDTFCGTAWAFDGSRDTDWYLVDHPGGLLRATVVSQFPAVCFIVDGIADCAPVIAGEIGCSENCEPIADASANLPPGEYVVFVAAGTCDGGGIFEGIPCDGGNNDYVVEIDCEVVEPPPNDECANAVPVEVPSETPGTTSLATVDDAFPFCDTSITAPGVWYSVVGTGNTMTASTCTDFFDYDTKLSVFCVSCDDATCVAGNDDNCEDGASALLSTVEWCSQEGAEYLILVHGFSDQSGDFLLIVGDDGMPCEDAIECIPPEPTGGCCLCDGAEQFCEITTEAECAAMGGEYLGDDTGCEPGGGEQVVRESFPNVPIPDQDPVGVSDTIDMGMSFEIADLEVGLVIDHTWIGDLCVTLEKAGGPTITLIQRMNFDGPCDGTGCCGCGSDNLDVQLDDQAVDAIEDACGEGGGLLTGTFVPDEPLGVYTGMDSAGEWTLTVSDNAGADTGAFLAWSLTFSMEGGGATPCEEEFPDQCEIEGFLDIKAGSCPNPLNRKSRGVLPVALVGTDDFDVMDVDLATLELARADGVGGFVMPRDRPGPNFEDVATPFEGESCDCHEMMGDGIMDLSMKFGTQALVEALELGDLEGGDFVELVLSGSLLDGTNFFATDCVWLVPPHGAAAAAPGGDENN